MAVPNPSDVVAAAVGTPSVAEAAALIGGGHLVVAKQKSANATVAVARLPVRGWLLLISTGPGDESLVPDMARDALGGAEVVIGLDQYVDRVRRWLRPGSEVLASAIGDEVRRAEQAVATARAGRVVALLEAAADPALVIGLPVGFVDAIEFKQALRDTGLPAISNRSEKGGSAVAAAAANALLIVPHDAADPRSATGPLPPT